MIDQQQDTVITPNDGPAQDAVTVAVSAAVLAAQMKIIDVAVRNARAQSWCGEFERIMGQIFPDGPPDGAAQFVDSEGWSCRGLDRDGYNRNGLDRDGYNRDGYNQDGFDRDGYDRQGFNRRGWNRDGLNRDGRDRNDPAVRTQYPFDYYGNDRDGYNRNGNDPWGRTREENAAAGLDPYRFDVDGHDIDGRRNY